MIRNRWRYVAVVLAMSMATAACGWSETLGLGDDGDTTLEEEVDGAAAPDVTEPVGDDAAVAGPSGTIRIANSVAVNSLNPHDDQTPATYSYYAWVYEGLVRQAADGSFTPWLAENWEVSEDGLTVTFNLHQGVTFSDGTPFTAQSVKANLDYVKTGPPDQVIPPVAGQLANVTEVEVVHEHRVAVHLAQPGEIALIAWLSRNSGLMVSPSSLGSAAAAPVGTGPYVFNAAESAADLVHLVFNANPTYWQPEQVGLDKVEIDVINDSAARKQAFEAGQYDMVTAALNLGKPDVGLESIGPSVIFSFTVTDWQGEVIPALANKDVRCAMAQALNREGLVAQANAPAESIRYQWAGADTDYAWIDDLQVPTFDIEGAKAAFTATGESGFTFGNGFLPNTPFEMGSVVWGGALNELGITMENEPFDPPSGGEMFGAFTGGRYPIQVIPINEPHPLMTLQQRAITGGTLNPTGVGLPEVEALVQEASKKNNEEAEADIEAAWKIMLEECIWIPWFNLYDGYWYHENVTGVQKVVGIPIGLWPQGIRVAG